MSTTAIRLPQDLKERVARAAERAGSAAHSFIFAN
jgi:predicted DNA-binding protein